jgi:type I restriction enzyme, R subunit
VEYLDQLVQVENLDKEKLEKVIGDYLFTEKEPLRDDLIDMLQERPSLKERSSTSERLKNIVMDFVETYITGVFV